MLHLPRRDELGHRPDRLLDGYLGVYSVLVVEVYALHAEPLERGLARPPDVLGPAVDTDPAPVLAPLVAELGGQDHLVAPVHDSFAHQFLVGERAVHVRRVEEGNAELYGALDRGYRLLFVPRAVELAHPHAPEPQSRDHESFATQVSTVHTTSSRDSPPGPPEFIRRARNTPRTRIVGILRLRV